MLTGSHGSPSSSPPASFSSLHHRKTDENSNTNIAAHPLDRTGSISPASMESNHTGDGDERAAKSE